jgi:hypothetical protein
MAEWECACAERLNRAGIICGNKKPRGHYCCLLYPEVLHYRTLLCYILCSKIFFKKRFRKLSTKYK